METPKAEVAASPQPRRGPLPITPIVEPEKEAHAQYAGSQSCKACHAELFAQWAVSNHGMAERPLRDDLDKTAFDPAKTVAHGTQSSEAKLADGKPVMVTLGSENKVEPQPIERAIGHDPLRQYLVKAFGGRSRERWNSRLIRTRRIGSTSTEMKTASPASGATGRDAA